MKGGRGSALSIDEMRERVQQDVMVTDWRAVSYLFVVGLELEARLAIVMSEAAAEAGIDPARVLSCSLRRDEMGTAELRDLNRARDLVIKENRLIYIVAHSPEDVRFFHATAPDFSSTLDAIIEIEPPTPPGDWLGCAADIRALMATRHATLDFTGLLPNTAERRELPLREVYQALVEIEPNATASGEVPGYLALGDPGTGKTTYLRYLAWAYATGSDDPLGIGTKVPVLVPLSDYGEDRARNRVRPLIEFLPDWLKQQGIADARAVGSHLHDVVLLLDAVDELSSAEARRAVLHEVIELVQTGAVGALVVTGRSFLVDEWLPNLPQGFPSLRVVAPRPPSTAQVHAFIDAFARLRGRTHEASQKLARSIDMDGDLLELARTPLMLAFMVVLDDLEGRLPDRRVEIYHRLGELLVDRWIRARSLATHPTHRERPTRADALRVLGPLAWWMVETGGGAVDEDRLMAELVRIESERELVDEARRRAAAMLDLLRSDTALLVSLADRRWRFVHSSIAEYFAGIEATRDPERWKTLLDDPFHPTWQELVLFAAGQLGTIEGRTNQYDALVNAILVKSRRPGRYDLRYPSLIVRLLLLEAAGLGRRQMDQLVARSLRFAFDSAFHQETRRRAQRTVLILLVAAQGRLKASVGEALRARLEHPADIRWERVFSADWELWRRVWSMGHDNGEVRATLLLGPVIATLPQLREMYEIDVEPLRQHWRAQPEWIFRFALWWLDASPEQRAQPPQQILDQLPD